MTPAIPEEPSNGSGLPMRSPFLDRPSLLVDILGQGIRVMERGVHSCCLYSKGATVTLDTRVPYRNGSVRTLHLSVCPYLTCSPLFASVVVLFSSDSSRIKLQVVDSRCANYLYHSSCFYDIPGHACNTDDYTEPSSVFITGLHDVCCNTALGPSVTLSKNTRRSLTARNICNQVSERRR